MVEDEPSVARGLKYGLEHEGFQVQWAETGQQALSLARSMDPHLVLLDLRLPDISGFDVCRQLRASGFRQPILMLTARDEELDKVLGLELGADDYMVKPFSLRELLARIRALFVAPMAIWPPPGVERVIFGSVEVDLERLQVTRQGRLVDLTPTEFRLLRHLVTNPDRPLTCEALIETVWGYTSDIENDRTVDVHIRHLREKLEARPANPRWLVTVRGIGYKFIKDP